MQRWRLLQPRVRYYSQQLVLTSDGNTKSMAVLATKCDYVKALYGFRPQQEVLQLAARGEVQGGVSDYRTHQAARMALQNFLHYRRGLPLDDAVFISDNAPRYLKRLQELLVEQQQQEDEASRYAQLKKGMEELLQNEGVDEMEPFLESLGLDLEAAPASASLTGDRGLLRLAKVVEEEAGIQRRTFWGIVAAGPGQVMNYSLRDCMDVVGVLEALGISRGHDMNRLLQQCPAIFRVELEEEMRPCVQQLERLLGGDAARTVISSILLEAPSRMAALKRVNVEALLAGMARAAGLADAAEAGRVLLVDNPLLLVGTSLAKVEALMEYLTSEALLLEDHEAMGLVRRYPRVLGLNLERSVVAKVNYLRTELRMDRVAVRLALVKHPEALAFSLEDNLRPKVLLLDSLGLDRFRLGVMLFKHPSLLLDVMANDIKRKANFLVTHGGVSEKSLSGIFHNHPESFTVVLKEARPRIEYLRGLGVELKRLGFIITGHPQVLSYDVHDMMKPVIDFFRGELRMHLAAVPPLLERKPSILGASPMNLRRAANYLLSLGFKRGTVGLWHTVAQCHRIPTSFMEERVEKFCALGLSREEVVELLQHEENANLLCIDEDMSLGKLDYYLNTMKMPLKELLRFPQYMEIHLENIIKPRHRLVSWLKAKGIVRRDYPPIYIHISIREFEETFIECHPQARDIFRGVLPRMLQISA